MTKLPLLRLFLILAIAGISAAIVAGFVGFVHPALDTAAHFRLHLAAGLFVLAVAAIAMRARRAGGAAMVLALAAAASCWQAFPASFAGAAPQGKLHSLLFFNMRYDNPAPERVIEMIRQTNADLVLLTEYSRMWEPRLVALHGSYPHRYHCAEWRDVGGTVVFSRFPLEPGYCHAYAALGLARADINGVPVTIGAAHMRWPWPASGPRQLRELRPVLDGLGPDALVAGDFNATVWSDAVASFAHNGGLEIVPGIGPTWMISQVPASLARFMGLPIDNVLAKGAVKVVSAKTLPPHGSDHLPILVTFNVNPG
ncbi:MAG TPA: endonuclease/exonuclease/phosphatase family protein [Rhizobiaceae bacterium]|nr:endonuclease/exonuclease/phosphatase family protein [Rhizobiaceae bacterium]